MQLLEIYQRVHASVKTASIHLIVIIQQEAFLRADILACHIDTDVKALTQAPLVPQEKATLIFHNVIKLIDNV